MVEVVAPIEMAEHQEFERETEDERGAERQHERGEEIPGQGIEGDRQIRSQHVLDAVREIDEVHHAEHKRQPGRDQEQDHAELKPVQHLDDKERGGHYARRLHPRRGQESVTRCFPSAILPRETGEGDHAQHGGGGARRAGPLHRPRSQACAGCASLPAMGGPPPPLRGGG